MVLASLALGSRMPPSAEYPSTQAPLIAKIFVTARDTAQDQLVIRGARQVPFR